MEIKWNTIMKELTELKNGEEMEKKMENYGVEKWKKNGKKTLIFFYWGSVSRSGSGVFSNSSSF